MPYKNRFVLFFGLHLLLLFILLSIGCAPYYDLHDGHASEMVHWEKSQWIAHGGWQFKDGHLHRNYTWEPANYIILEEPSPDFSDGIISFSMDVFNTVDTGLLFGIKAPPSSYPYIPENAFVLVIRNQDIYFNQRKEHSWQQPISKKEYTDLSHTRIHVILNISGLNAFAYLYDRETGSLIASIEAELPETPSGTIGFYSYIDQDIHTSIHALELRHAGF